MDAQVFKLATEIAFHFEALVLLFDMRHSECVSVVKISSVFVFEALELCLLFCDACIAFMSSQKF